MTSMADRMSAEADYNHYARKWAITRALVFGTPVTALCGETWVPTSQGANAVPGCETANDSLPDCPDCDRLFGLLEAAEVATDAGVLS